MYHVNRGPQSHSEYSVTCKIKSEHCPDRVVSSANQFLITFHVPIPISIHSLSICLQEVVSAETSRSSTLESLL